MKEQDQGMSTVERSALVNYSAQQMYDLVNDVSCYSEFLPGCVGSHVIEQSNDLMVASMELKKGPIRQTFTTRNTLIAGESITMELQDGPFKFLHGIWHFKKLSETASKVELDLKFEFNNRLTEAAFGKIFINLTSKLVDSFVIRAGEIYDR